MMIGWVFVLSGAAIGAAHAGLLARAARSGPPPWSMLVRYVLVGGVLLVAARAGHLAAGTAGWITGLVVAGVVVHRRLS